MEISSICSKEAQPQPTQLLFDGQKAHTENVNLIAKARDNNVVLISNVASLRTQITTIGQEIF